MRKLAESHEGKAKIIYSTPEEDQLIVYYKDDTTAGNGAKRAQIQGKGELNLKISEYFFNLLAGKVETHYLETLSPREMLVRKVEIIPLEVVVRNIAAGSIAKRLGLDEGKKLPRTVVEFYYKDDALGDPLVNTDHILALGAATCQELDQLKEMALRVNSILEPHLSAKGLILVDFKLEFGRTAQGEILLADEISPDTCRFWDSKSQEKLDKDRFRRDLGGVAEAYAEVYRRLCGK
jgi:phosphoribosylaminoimidazole-succinocarboxamide synthase